MMDFNFNSHSDSPAGRLVNLCEAGVQRRKPRRANRKLANQVLSIADRPSARKESLESILSSAVRCEDPELNEILRTLNELADIVKSRRIDAAAADDALRRAAVWAVEKSLLDRQLRSLAITDEVTGLFNRRGFLAAAAQQLKLAQRDSLNLLLFFCDVDDMKRINDSFGHREGDLALVRTADALEETFRDSDLLARLGGDEFAVLAWEASFPEVNAILTRLSKSLDKTNAEEPRYRLSLSVGIERFDPQRPAPLGELMARADEEMYKQKRNHGRAAVSCR
jgi:diguanylate cyclase (GGDEF)-like protein